MEKNKAAALSQGLQAQRNRGSTWERVQGPQGANSAGGGRTRPGKALQTDGAGLSWEGHPCCLHEHRPCVLPALARGRLIGGGSSKEIFISQHQAQALECMKGSEVLNECTLGSSISRRIRKGDPQGPRLWLRKGSEAVGEQAREAQAHSG